MIGTTYLVTCIVDVVGAIRVLIPVRMTRANLILYVSIVVVLLYRLSLAGKSDTDWRPHPLCHPQRIAIVLQELARKTFIAQHCIGSLLAYMINLQSIVNHLFFHRLKYTLHLDLYHC